MSCEEQKILEWAAGQDRDEPLAFALDGVPVDLTGSTVSLVVMESFSDAEPWQVFSQTEHVDAVAGQTSLAVDLTDVPAEWRVSGKRLVGTLWVVDSQGKVNHWGNYTIQIHPAAPLPTPDP